MRDRYVWFSEVLVFVAVAFFSLLLTVSCSPVSPSVDKINYSQSHPLQDVQTEGSFTSIVVSAAEFNGTSTLTNEQVQTFRNSGNLDISFSDSSPVSGYFIVNLEPILAAELIEFRAELSPIADKTWRLSVNPDVTDGVRKTILENLSGVTFVWP